MATHNVKVTYSGPAQSQSNPDEVSVSIIGQVPNLKLVKFEELQSKFGSCVTSKVILSERSVLLTFRSFCLRFEFSAVQAVQSLAVPRHHT